MTKLDEVSGKDISISEQLTEMIEYKKQELTRIQREVLAEQSILASTKQQQEVALRDAKYQNRIEEEAHQKRIQEQAQPLQGERKEIERLDKEVNTRLKDVETLEAQAAPIHEALQQLKDERIAIEQQRVRNDELQQEYTQLVNATNALHEETSQAKAAMFAEQQRVHVRAVEQEQQQLSLDKREQDVTVALDNLAKIKADVDPKLDLITKHQEAVETALRQTQEIRAEITTRQADMDKQKSDLAILSNQLDARSSALSDYDAGLKRTASALQIKIQQSKMKGVTVPEAPKE